MNLSKETKFAHYFLAIFMNPWFIYRRLIYLKIRGLKSIWGGKAVLDVGCGSKPYKKLFGNASRYIGTDVNVTGHDHTDSEVDIYFDGVKLPFDDNEFDVVVLFEVLEHVEDLDQLLSDIARVLKDDGSLILSTPFIWEEHEMPYDFRRFTKIGLRKTCEKYGFVPEFESRNGSFAATILQVICNKIFILAGNSRIFRIIVMPFVLLFSLLGYFLNSFTKEDQSFYLFNLDVYKNKAFNEKK